MLQRTIDDIIIDSMRVLIGKMTVSYYHFYSQYLEYKLHELVLILVKQEMLCKIKPPTCETL